MCSSSGGSTPAVAATIAPVKIFASSVHNCLSAFTSCSSVMREWPGGGGVFMMVSNWLIHLLWHSQLLKRTWSSANARLCKHHCSCIDELWSASKLASGADSLSVWCSSCTTDGKLLAPCCISCSREVALLGAIHKTLLVSIIPLTASIKAYEGCNSPSMSIPVSLRLWSANLACFSMIGSFCLPSSPSPVTFCFSCATTKVADSKCKRRSALYVAMLYPAGKMPSANVLKASSLGGLCGVPEEKANELNDLIPPARMAVLAATSVITSASRCSKAAALSTSAMSWSSVSCKAMQMTVTHSALLHHLIALREKFSFADDAHEWKISQIKSMDMLTWQTLWDHSSLQPSW